MPTKPLGVGSVWAEDLAANAAAIEADAAANSGRNVTRKVTGPSTARPVISVNPAADQS